MILIFRNPARTTGSNLMFGDTDTGEAWYGTPNKPGGKSGMPLSWWQHHFSEMFVDGDLRMDEGL